MKNDMERCHVVYDVLKTHIQFGAYRFGDVLPTMENNTENFLVSLDTIRSAYLQLEREGYITLSQNVGSTVIKNYSEQEIEQNVQLFFSLRKSALIDLSRSLRPLFTNAQWIGLKNAPSEIYNNMLELRKDHGLQPFIAFNHMMQAYDSLGNDLLTRLLWQVYCQSSVQCHQIYAGRRNHRTANPGNALFCKGKGTVFLRRNRLGNRYE